MHRQRNSRSGGTRQILMNRSLCWRAYWWKWSEAIHQIYAGNHTWMLSWVRRKIDAGRKVRSKEYFLWCCMRVCDESHRYLYEAKCSGRMPQPGQFLCRSGIEKISSGWNNNSSWFWTQNTLCQKWCVGLASFSANYNEYRMKACIKLTLGKL